MRGDLRASSIDFLSLAVALSYRRIIVTMVYKNCPDSRCLARWVISCKYSAWAVRALAALAALEISYI
jgi:hypothetical protein